MQDVWIFPNERVAAWRCRVWQAIQIARSYPSLEPGSMVTSDIHSGLLAPRAWQLLAAGMRAEARRYFRAALHHDPYAVSAWVGLSRTVDSREERRRYLQAAFDIAYLIHTLQRRRAVNGEDEQGACRELGGIIKTLSAA